MATEQPIKPLFSYPLSKSAKLCTIMMYRGGDLAAFKNLKQLANSGAGGDKWQSQWDLSHIIGYGIFGVERSVEGARYYTDILALNENTPYVYRERIASITASIIAYMPDAAEAIATFKDQENAEQEQAAKERFFKGIRLSNADKAAYAKNAIFVPKADFEIL